MRSRVGKSECSESEAFVGTGGRGAGGEPLDSEREGGFRGRLQGGASGGETAGFPQQAPRLPCPEGTGDNYRRNLSQAEKCLKPLQAARAAFSSLPRPEGAGDRDGTSTDKRNFGSFGYGVLLSIAQNIFKARQAGRRGVSVNIKYVFQGKICNNSMLMVAALGGI